MKKLFLAAMAMLFMASPHTAAAVSFTDTPGVTLNRQASISAITIYPDTGLFEIVYSLQPSDLRQVICEITPEQFVTYLNNFQGLREHRLPIDMNNLSAKCRIRQTLLPR